MHDRYVIGGIIIWGLLKAILGKIKARCCGEGHNETMRKMKTADRLQYIEDI